MRAISLWQPWASLIADGYKQVETRSWSTGYRGPLAIHAAKKIVDWPSPYIAPLFDDFITEPRDLPRGCVVCVVRLWDVVRITRHNRPGSPESEFGDYREGRFMWRLKLLERLTKPYPCAGRQGLFEVDL